MLEEVWGGNGGGVVREAALIATLFSCGFFGVRFLLNNLIYKRLARRLLNIGAAKVVLDDARRAKIVKCTESMWKLTYYASMQLWVYSIIRQEPWSLDTKQYFKGWPDHHELRLSLKLFYMCQGGFYVYSIAALLIWETRRKDFSIMMAHHIITSSLIGYSFLMRFFRVGTIILALHDTSDLFMESAKIFKYSEKDMAASFCFGLFAISWFILRLIYFPFWIIKLTSFETIELMVLGLFPESAYYAFNTMLLMLLIFHIYWWKLICAMILRQLGNKGQVGEDIRSDSEDD